MPKIRKGHFTEPQISPKNPSSKNLFKSWFIWFRYFDASEPDNKKAWKLISLKGDINDIPDFRERLKSAKQLCKAIKEQLEGGFNPLTKNFEKPELTESNPFDKMTLNEAMDFALSKCEVASKTKAGYTHTVTYCKEAARRVSLSKMPVKEVKKQHIKLILEEAKKKRKWSNKAYNKYLGYLQAVLSRLHDWELIEQNPAYGIKALPVAESEKYVPISDEEKKIIRDYLYINHYRYFVFIMVLFHCGIRPKEILSLKISDVDLNNNLITITPDLDLENAKTKKIRKVPINKHLLPFLRELELHLYNKEFYVFGSPYVSGRGNSGSARGKKFGVMHPDYFKPSSCQIKRDTVTKFWKKVVKDKLGIDKYQYSLKHSGANAMILAGIDLDALKTLYGHSSKHTTSVYATKVKELYKQQIIENAPEF